MTEHHRRLFRILTPYIGLALFSVWGLVWGVDLWRKRLIGDNERHAARARFEIISAECQFALTDLDRNGIRDYWTGDVAGLFRFGLIDRALAEADDRPLVPLVPKPVPWHGYFVHLMQMDDNEQPPEPFAQVTDAASGPVHHLTKVAVCLYPAEPGISGRYIFMLNNSGCIRRHPWPGPNGGAPRNWPSDKELMGHWSNDCGG